jgi:hypothetical protein
MPRTNTLHSLVQSRVARDPDFAAALLREGIDTMLTGDIDTGKAILRDYIKATVGFEKLGEATDTPPKSLIRMFGPRGNPQARNVSTTLIQPVTIFTLASVPMASPRFDLIANPPVRRARCGPFLVRVALSGVSWEASMAGRRGTRRRRTQRHRAVGDGDRVNLERCDGAACT